MDEEKRIEEMKTVDGIPWAKSGGGLNPETVLVLNMIRDNPRRIIAFECKNRKGVHRLYRRVEDAVMRGDIKVGRFMKRDNVFYVQTSSPDLEVKMNNTVRIPFPLKLEKIVRKIYFVDKIPRDYWVRDPKSGGLMLQSTKEIMDMVEARPGEVVYLKCVDVDAAKTIYMRIRKFIKYRAKTIGSPKIKKVVRRKDVVYVQT